MKPSPVDSLSFFPDTPLSLPIPKLSDETLTALGTTLKSITDTNLANRAALDANLDIWNAIYEMRTSRTFVPWEGCADIVLPIVANAVDELVSRIVGSALVPRPYTFRGNDPNSAQYSHFSEDFMNNEFDLNGSYDAHELAIRLAAQDGTSFMGVFYELSTHQEVRVAEEPVTGPDGQPVIGPDGKPKTQAVKKLVDMVEYDAPREYAIDLKSLQIYPNHAMTIDSANGVGWKRWMDETDMQKMVNSGIFRPDIVEKVLNYTTEGQGERALDPQGNSIYTVAGMINIVDIGQAPPAGIGMVRGPVMVWQWHTNLFDLDGDGVAEENVIWMHYQSSEILGFAPFEYWGDVGHRRPFLDLTLWPRRNLPYGFAVPERMRGIQEEADTQRNQRLDFGDLAIKPMRYRTNGVRTRETDRRWAPDTEIEVDSKDDFGFIPMPPFPEWSVAEEQSLYALADRTAGAPQTSAIPGAGGSQQRSAKAAQQNAVIQGMQSNMVVSRVRRWMLAVARYKYRLYVQYGKDQLQTISRAQDGPPTSTLLPKEILAQSYTMGVAGLGGPLDKEGRRTDVLMFIQLVFSTPLGQLFQGNLPRLWNLARMAAETFEFPEVTSIIGTYEEAQQQQQAAAQAQQEQQQIDVVQNILAHRNDAHAPGRGAPAGGAPPPALQAPPAA